MPLYSDLVRYANACGCGVGAIGVALAGCLYLLGLALLPTIAAGVVGGVAGKCLGLWWAHRRFDAVVRNIEEALQAREEG
ncbi:hypothetical protein [Streptomyces ureilyticus]|uniref:Uncharacterized protein n=1 Tax=Streptomyces ureilyticus TaxID=1775131 RepID=A0ABX0E899_9ACTN|nr:hypothetical protein [Streptomyces ureilyticus]NGO49174.1 hypothetical protein [Streptomyces ureilyticus]